MKNKKSNYIDFGIAGLQKVRDILSENNIEIVSVSGLESKFLENADSEIKHGVKRGKIALINLVIQVPV